MRVQSWKQVKYSLQFPIHPWGYPSDAANRRQSTFQGRPQTPQQSYPPPNSMPPAQNSYPRGSSISAIASPNISNQQRSSCYFGGGPQMVYQKPYEYYAYPNGTCQSPLVGYLNPSQSMLAMNSHQGMQQPYYQMGNGIAPGYSSPALFSLSQLNQGGNNSYVMPQNIPYIQQNPNIAPTYSAYPFYS